MIELLRSSKDWLEGVKQLEPCVDNYPESLARIVDDTRVVRYVAIAFSRVVKLEEVSFLD